MNMNYCANLTLGVLAMVIGCTSKVSELTAPVPANIQADAPTVNKPVLPSPPNERDVAQKIFELGGTICVLSDGVESNFIKTADALPKSDFTISYVGLWHLPKVSDEDLLVLRGLENLRGIGLDNTGITDRSLEHYEKMKSVIRIEISGTKVTEQGLEALLKKHPEITDLIISDLPITDKIMPLVGRSTFLWAHRTKITDSGLKYFLGKSIKTLFLDGTTITDEGLKSFSGTSILNFSLAGTTISDAGLSHLAMMAHIGELNLQGTAVTPDGVNELLKRFPDCKITR